MPSGLLVKFGALLDDLHPHAQGRERCEFRRAFQSDRSS